jgi:hypothetical protein
VPPAPQALPQRVVYGQVFKYVVLLDVQAGLGDQRGQNGNQLRNYFQTKATLTDAETALLKSTAHSTVSALQDVDQQIHAAVIAYRGQLQNIKSSTTLPPLPSELHTLQTQKDNLILSGLAAVQTGLGAGRFQNLDAFVQREIAPHITLNRANASAPHPKNSSLPPMQPVPWQ